ncbi:hypothetical protein [Actinokineospora cianjurensis]|uniref:Uncharacterized protein n=1 Tax=Actinokineospora cianjurensis TaxID=585224 RepID=A0A421AX99_9PSEU|nr:hypothetical protein [Actinokineospora cianjurensis]RLK54421.1 hypothetical protein CLV68_5971 [Actinokineospora cianjurensis]
MPESTETQPQHGRTRHPATSQTDGTTQTSEGSEAPGGGAPTSTVIGEDGLPDWARKELTKVRGEAA